MKLFQWLKWANGDHSKSESSKDSSKENLKPSAKIARSKSLPKSRSLPKSKSAIVVGSDLSWESVKENKKQKKPSLVQKLRGYNELLDELQKLKLEYESVQREKISLRDRLSEESERQRDTDENHQNRVNGLLNEFKKVKIENDKLQSQMAELKEQIVQWRTQFQEEKQNISDLIESQCDAEVEIHELRKDMNGKLSLAEDELAKKIREFEELRSQKESVEKTVENKNREIEHLEKENTSKLNDIERLKSENLDITQHMEDLRLEKEDVITQNVLLINQLSEKNDKILAAVAERENLEREISRLEVTLEGNRREIANLKKQIVINETEYRNQLADAESEFADERASHESETSEWSERIDTLTAEKSRLASENAQLLADKDGLLSKLSELESEMSRINARLDNVVEESATKTDNYIQQIKSFEEQANEERKELEEKISGLVKIKSELTEEVMEMVRQANIATESNSELKQMNGDLAKEIARQQAIIHSQSQANEQYLERIHSLDDKLERLMAELSDNQSCLQQLQADQSQLQSDLEEKDRHLKTALSENDRLNELIREFEELQRPSEETLVESDSMDQLLANLKTKEDENKQLLDENSGYIENSKLLAKKNLRLEKQVCELLEEVNKVRDQEADLLGNNQKFAELKNENAKLRGIVADLKQWDIKREEELNDCRKKEQNMKFLNRKLTERLILNQKESRGNNDDLIMPTSPNKLKHSPTKGRK